jgi:hypothetical protein
MANSMKAIFHNVEREIYQKLLTELNSAISALSVGSVEQVKKHLAEGTFPILGGWKGDSIALLNSLLAEGKSSFPMPDLALRLIHRFDATKELDRLTSFRNSYTRNYFVGAFEVPDHGTEYTVVKVGNKHVGDGKFRKVPRSPFNLRSSRETAITEPFIEGRSIRAYIAGDYMTLVEHINTTNWIKNVSPQQEICFSSNGDEVLRSIEDDARGIQKALGADLIGIDYQLASDGRVLPLEINSMPGCPTDANTLDQTVKLYKKVIERNFNL